MITLELNQKLDFTEEGLAYLRSFTLGDTPSHVIYRGKGGNLYTLYVFDIFTQNGLMSRKRVYLFLDEIQLYFKT